MKIFLFGFIATILVSTFSFGQDFKNILNDEDFKAYLKDVSVEQNRSKDFKKIKEYNLDGKIDENELKELHLAIGYNTQEDFFLNLESQSNRLINLEKKYGLSKFSQTQLVNLLDEGFTFLEIPIINPGNVVYGDCDRRFRNCMLIALGTAVGGHVACGAADLTVFLGIVCHAAVATLQYAMQDNCGLDYKECNK